MTAASNSAVRVAAPLNVCSVIIVGSRSSPVNGPRRSAAASTTVTDTNRLPGTTPACWNRSAAQMSSGKSGNSIGKGNQVTVSVTATRTATSTAASAQRAGGTRQRQSRVAATSRTGATTSTPIASPVHHTAQVARTSSASSAPAATRDQVPVVALISMPPSAATNTRATTSLTRRRSSRNPALASSRHAQTGASVLPAEIATTAGSVGPTSTFARNAPIVMPGQHRTPNNSRHASAMPVGGHSGVT
jgi:hypothetical protein